ncbi:MAG: glycosyltransferase family 39 protein, partial [Planctomycetaceae bacterium]|nr:glycosyltransferase family 39 protein [Planctomycetaceae bacterium]
MTDLPRKIRLESGWIALILLPYVVLLLAVPLGGEFPLLDDFDYAASAWHLADTGRLRFSDWPAMTLVTHVAWGALASKLAGNSFAVLRGSMCVLSCAAAIAIYAGARRCGHSRPNGVLAAWCFAVHPMTVEFEYTFMTDITGAALSAILLACSPVVQRASVRRLCGYSVLGGLAYLARETAAIPWIMVLAATAWQCARSSASWRRLVWLTAPAALMIAAYEYWLRAFHVLPFNRSLPSLDWTALIGDPSRLPFLLTASGLAMAPLGVMAIASADRNARRIPILLAAAIGIAAAAMVGAGTSTPPPYRGDIFDLGLRPPEMPLGHIPASLRGPSMTIGERDVSVMRVVTTALGWFFATGIAAAIFASRQLAPLRSQFRGDSPLPVAT